MTDETKTLSKRKSHPFLTGLSVLGVILLIAVIAAIAFPSTILRFVFSRIKTETDIAITFDNAHFYISDGSFLRINGLSVKRQNHALVNFDLKADNVQMPAMIPKDFYAPVLLIFGLRGTIERVGSDDTTEEGEIPIKALMLLDSEVDFIDRTLEKPFQEKIQIKKFFVSRTDGSALFEPFYCGGTGQIGIATFNITHNEQEDHRQKMEFTEVPFDLLSPYVPVLDDIFVAGSMNVQIDEISDEIQKKLRVNIRLLPDCQIKPANEILVPAIQSALNGLDESSVSALHDLRGKLNQLQKISMSLRSEVDKFAQLAGVAIAFAPRDIREQYENAKNRYDQFTNNFAKFETLLQELDRVKVGIIEDTFKHLIATSVPIEIELREVNGEWQYDGYDAVVRLIERNYQAIIAAQYQKRFQELNESIDRLLAP